MKNSTTPFLLLMIVSLFFFVSCGELGQHKDSGNQVNNNNKEETGNNSNASNRRKEVVEDITREEVIDFVNTWGKLYTNHVYENYIKQYDPINFKGIKRTYQGERNVYDYNGWQSNKISEFKKYQPEVIVEDIKVKYLNQDGRSKVRFMQTWVSYKTNYADRGEKELTLKKVNGEILIEREELLYSEPANDYFGGT